MASFIIRCLQIGSISLKPEGDTVCDLVVSQPGGAYVILKPDGQ